MNKQEVVKLLTLIKANYPNYNKDLTAEEGGLLIDFWVDLFGEYEFKIVGAALQAFIAKDTKGFAPVPGQLLAEIRKLVARVENKPETTAAQAWDMVVEVLRGPLCYYDPGRAFAKLPLAIQKCVGSARILERWSVTNSEQLHDYIRSQFMRDYKDMAGFYRDQDALPYSVKKMLGQGQGLVSISHRDTTRDMTEEEYERMCSLDDYPGEESAEA